MGWRQENANKPDVSPKYDYVDKRAGNKTF